jgi:isopentenyldiphosphate isomerase
VSEPLDIVDPADGHRLDTLPRDIVHQDGHWHQVFHCLIVRPSASTVILQERAAGKSSFPGLLDLSATGHLAAGETPIDGLRELSEELGVTIAHDRLVPLGARLLADRGGAGANRERMHVYLFPDDRPPAAYRPDPSEVSALVEVGADDLLSCLAGGGAAPAGRIVHPGTGSAATPVTVTPVMVAVADLVPAVDGYWTVLLIMVQRYLAGRRPLAI